MGEKKQIHFIRKLTVDYFGGFYYFYILIIKIKYSSITHDRGQWNNFPGRYNFEVKPGFDFISSAVDECHCPSCSSNS